MKHWTKLFCTLLLTVSVAVSFFSCGKNKKSELKITVVDGVTNSPISGASVHVYPPPTANSALNTNLNGQDQTSITDASGHASFTFKLPAILQTDVTPPAALGLNIGGTLVTLEEGQTTSTVIKLY